MKKTLLALATVAALSSTSAAAQSIPQNDKAALKLFFSASVPTNTTQNAFVPPMPELNLLGAKVTAPTSCKGNIGLTIANAFTDGTLQKIYENFDQVVKQLASPEGLIFLATLYISKSNPNLYQLITEGINIGIEDFLSAMGSCEAMAAALVDVAADPLIEMQQQTKFNQFIETNAKQALDEEWNDIRVEDMVRGGMDKLSENGITLFGKQWAGKNQPALDVMNTTLKYGWCIYRGMTEEQCMNTLEDGDKKLPGLTPTDELIIGTEDDLATTGIHILGNKYLSICQGCETVQVSGTGITAYIEADQARLAQNINLLSKRPINSITEEEYEEVGFAPSIVADANYFSNLAMLENDVEVRNMYLYGWAYDVAYQRAIHALDMLENSMKAMRETNGISGSGIKSEIERLLGDLEVERNRLDRNSQKNNYVPKMYVRSLLSVSKRLADGKSPAGLMGASL